MVALSYKRISGGLSALRLVQFGYRFLVLFVVGLGVVGWLISVVARAERVMESAVIG